MAFSTELVQHDKLQKTDVSLYQIHSAEMNAAFVDEPSDLEVVRRTSVNLAIWQRDINQLMMPVVDWLVRKPFEFDYEVETKNVSSVLRSYLPEPPELEGARAQLIADIQELATLYSEYASTHFIRLMLESLHSVPCPKFHRDNVSLRLVCTYTGSGTEWLENSNVNAHPDCCGGSLVLDPSRIMQLKPFEVALLKGKCWPDNKTGIFHRSPPVVAGQSRLIVKMDVTH
jgi:hypothetical protein